MFIIKAQHVDMLSRPIKRSTNTTVYSVALGVEKRDLSSSCALFITWAFVISFDVFGCNVSALYNSAPELLLDTSLAV